MEAADNLRTSQKQLDMDGTMVGVSRQALDEVLATLTWRPIETAPKSTTEQVPKGHYVKGVYLLGFCPEEGATLESCIYVIWWEPHYSGEHQPAWVGEAGFEVHPTHWMHLPKPPAALSKAGV